MNAIFAAVPAMWQRELAALIWGGLLGMGFCGFGLLAWGALLITFHGRSWWKSLILLLVTLPFGSGVVIGLPLVCLWGAWTLAQQQPEVDDWIGLGFCVWPGIFAVNWLWRRIQRSMETTREVEKAKEAERQRLAELRKHFLTFQRENEGKIWARRWETEGPQEVEPPPVPREDSASVNVGYWVSVTLAWMWVIGWTAAVLYAALDGQGWMLAVCLTMATGSWCMAAWWRWYSRGGR